MNTTNSNAINMSKRDYFALPPNMREQANDGPLVLTMRNGRETFVPVLMLE